MLLPRSILLIFFSISAVSTVDADSSGNLTAAEQLLPFAIEYFHFHGVQNLDVILCTADTVDLSQRRLVDLARHLMINGFVVRFHHRSEFIILPSGGHKVGILVLNSASSCARRTLRQSSAKNYFTTNRFWLLLVTKGDDSIVEDDRDVFIPPDGEVRLLLAARAGVKLVDVYKVAKQKPFQLRIVALDVLTPGAMIEALKLFGSAISYRGDLEGIRLNTGLVIAFPHLFTNITDVSQGHIDTIAKVNYALTKELGDKLNFSFNTLQTDNYGWRQANGTFSGLMGHFQRENVDFGQTALFMRLDRIPVVDFIAETFHFRAGIMFRQPPLSAVDNIFTKPFNSDVWLAIGFFCVVTSLAMMIARVYGIHQPLMDMWDCGGFVWGAMCQQGFHVTITARSGRILVLTTFLASVFLFNSFSANIVALLQSPSESIQSLNDLSQSPLAIGVQDTVYNKVYFNESTDPVTIRLYRTKIQPIGEKVYIPAAVGIERMRTELYAYQVELQAGYRIISDTFSEAEKCGLMELEPFQLPMMAIPAAKNFKYKELFRRLLRRQREVGLMNREQRKWLSSKPKCESNLVEFKSIGTTECRYAFYVFCFGAVGALLVLIIELIVKRI